MVEVDLALSSLYKPGNCTIVNTDSGSTDHTRRVFLDTATKCRKLSFNLSVEPKGKGRNLFHFFEWAMKNDVTHLLTVDADVSSMMGSWIEKLSSPLIREESDFVTPLYRRDRFEAASTNHFAYPLVYGYLGTDIRQPIGGEFGMTRRAAKYILSRPIDTPATYAYGVDIFISMHLVAANFRTVQVDLGQKIHKPTFFKLSKIFRDVAETAISISRQHPISSTFNNYSEPHTVEESGTPPNHALSQNIFLKARREALNLEPLYKIWLAHRESEFEALIHREQPTMSIHGWSSLLAGCIAEALANPTRSPEDTADKLLPAFLLRTITFWTEVENATSSAVAETLLAQARMFREELEQRI